MANGKPRRSLKVKVDEDITGKIGPLHTTDGPIPEWPMYSFNRPAYAFWQGLAEGLRIRGFTEKQIKDALQSAKMRHYLDRMEEDIIACGHRAAISF